MNDQLTTFETKDYSVQVIIFKKESEKGESVDTKVYGLDDLTKYLNPGWVIWHQILDMVQKHEQLGSPKTGPDQK